MGALKWIGGIIGWAAGGPIGILIGVLLGKLVEDNLGSVSVYKDSTQTGNGQTWQKTWERTWGTGTGQTYQRSSRPGGGYSATEQRNSFMLSLLVLSSAVIRADRRIQQSELNYVKDFIRSNFGDLAVEDAMKVLNELNNKEIDIYSVGGQIAANMNYSQRLQLFHYLAGIANADRDFCQQEKSVLEAIASAIGLASTDAASVIAMYYKDTDSAYTVLEISPDATDDEVKSAYRRMAMKYHPDKVATLGPEVQKAAEEKFKKIQEAYESIKKQRGIS